MHFLHCYGRAKCSPGLCSSTSPSIQIQTYMKHRHIKTDGDHINGMGYHLDDFNLERRCSTILSIFIFGQLSNHRKLAFLSYFCRPKKIFFKLGSVGRFVGIHSKPKRCASYVHLFNCILVSSLFFIITNCAKILT